MIDYKFSLAVLPPSHLIGNTDGKQLLSCLPPLLALAADLEAVGKGNVDLIIGFT